MQSLLILNGDPDFLEKVYRALVNTGHRFRARCNDPDKALSVIGASQQSDEPVKVLLASMPVGDPRTKHFLQRVNQDFPEVATIVMEQSDASQTSMDVFSARRKGRHDAPIIPLDARGLSYIMNDALLRFADQRVRGQAIGRFCKKLQESTGSDDFIERFLDEALTFLKVEKGSIFFLDEKQSRMVLEAAKGGDGQELVGLTKNLGEGVAGYVAQEKKPLLVVSREAAPIPVTSSGKYETESFICAPILSNSRLIGVLNLTEKKSKRPFSETDLNNVMAILDQLSATIAQASLRKQLRDRNRRLSAEKKKAHERLRDLERKMQKSQRQAGMGEMIEGVAHEINSALDGTMRFVNMALKKAANDELLSEWLSGARMGLERICRIVKPVNQYARNGSKAFVETKLNDLLDDVLVLMSHKLMKHNIRMMKHFDPELPIVRARSDLDQVFINLIKNAFEAMQQDGTLKISTSHDEENVFIQFKDTGCGIPGEILSRLGERGLTTKENGIGLGISISKEIVRAHGGELLVESEVGVGSTFTVRLPLGQLKKGN